MLVLVYLYLRSLLTLSVSGRYLAEQHRPASFRSLFFYIRSLLTLVRTQIRLAAALVCRFELCVYAYFYTCIRI
jgi:hypothetical protein